MNDQQTFYSNGKLLLTGEYAILDGAKGLAVPTKFGQRLIVSETATKAIDWKSYDADGSCWFETYFPILDYENPKTNDKTVSSRLLEVLVHANFQSEDFMGKGVLAETHLTFPRKWGLGTSSTLVNNVAQWADINPYQLLKNTFGGSGYDIACARHNSPLIFQADGYFPEVEEVHFDPPFKDQLYFIYLNQKQDTKNAIGNYRKQNFDKNALINTVSELTLQIYHCDNLRDFEHLLDYHEALLSDLLKQKCVKAERFPDYFGSIKSLGAWGGDFILATGNEKTPDYFKAKGFDIVLSFDEMVL